MKIKLLTLLLILSAPAYAATIGDDGSVSVGGGSGGSGSTTVGGSLTGGTDTRVLFDDANTIGEDSGFTYNKTTDTLSVPVGLAINDPTPETTVDIELGTQTVPNGTTMEGMSVNSIGTTASNNTGAFHSIGVNPAFTGVSNLDSFEGIYSTIRNQATSGTVTDFISIIGRAFNEGHGTTSNLNGVRGDFQSTAGGTITNASAIYAAGGNITSGTIVTAYGVRVSAPAASASGVITNSYGINVPVVSGATDDNIGILIGSNPSGSITAPFYVGDGAGTSVFRDPISYNDTYSSASGTSTGLSLVNVQNVATTGTAESEFINITTNSSSGTVANVNGIRSRASKGAAGDVTNVRSFYAEPRNDNPNGTLAKIVGLEVANIVNQGSITNDYGVYIGDMTSNGITNGAYAIYSSDTQAATYLAGSLNVGSNSAYQTASGIIVDVPAAQTIAGGDTVTADSCGGVKLISSAGSVTTNTTNTFTAPASGNEGCIMHVCNSGANNITLDNNSNFKSFGAADVVMTADDCVAVGSTGGSGVWYQLTTLEAN